MDIPSYLGEIKICAGNFAPAGFALCDGSLLTIADHKELFTLIGTKYGGDGTTTFAVPDLRGRVPIHIGNGSGLSPRTLGEFGGVEEVTLTTNQLPHHTHVARGSGNPGNSDTPTDNFWSKSPLTQQFKNGEFTADAPMNPRTIGTTGNNEVHDNMLPFLALNFIISLNGELPPHQ